MSDLAGDLRDAERLIWGVSYRMLGVAADADEVVQDTFVRALEHRPDRSRPLRPWLVRVAVNLSRDRLRARRRRRYVGPWLPSPVDTGDGASGLAAHDPGAEGPELPDARYGRYESLTYAWLVAVEALTPAQRAVVVLRDVLDLTADEAAEALAMSPENVRVTHHRARRALAAYDQERAGPDLAGPTMAGLAALGAALQAGDLDAVVALLAPAARVATDGGGEFAAARNVVVGALSAARLLLGLQRKDPGAADVVAVATLNGLPALILRRQGPPPRPDAASTWALLVDVRGGPIRAIYTVSATAKLAR